LANTCSKYYAAIFHRPLRRRRL